MKPQETYLLMNIPDQVEAERVIIRRYAHGDGEAIFALAERNGNRDHLSGIADDMAGLKTVDEAEVLARRHRGEWATRDRFVAGVWLREDNSFIGELWIEPTNWEIPSFEIGWFIDKGHEGKGFAYEATRAGIEFIFNNLDAHKVIAGTHDNNTKSFKLAERLGFVKEGHTRESEIKDGKRFGRLLYGMLCEDFL